MMNKNKRVLLIAIPIIILMIVFGVSIPLITNIGDKMENSASKNLINSTYVMENNVSIKIDNDKEALFNFVNSGTPLTASNLEIFCHTRNYTRVLLIKGDGTGYDNDGKPADISNIEYPSLDISEGSTAASRCFYDKAGKKAVAFGTLVMEEGKSVGTLYAERKVDDYYSASVFSFYEGEGRGYLVDAENGEFVLKSLKSDGLPVIVRNLFDHLIESGNTQELLTQIKSFMADEKTGIAQVNFSGNECYLCLTPLSANSNWYLVTIIGKNDLMAESIAVRKTIIFMMSIVVVGLIAALVIFFIVILKNRKEQEQKKRTELLENVTTTVEHAFIVFDPVKHSVVYTSGNLYRLFGIDGRIVQKDISILLDWLNAPAEDQQRIQFLNGTVKTHFQRETEIVVDGQTRWVRSEVSPCQDGAYVLALTDITRDKEYADTLSMAMQNAENANRVKSEFLSSMSHDIRTPMNGIIGMAAIAGAHLHEPERVKDCLQKIGLSSQHLLGIINDVLDMSKIESGKMSLNNEEFNLADFMYNLIHMNNASIVQKKQKLTIRVSEIDHENVIADQVKLQQVMTNIVSNANKYTPEGGSIRLSLTEKTGSVKDYGCYEFVCQDSGIGMSSEFVAKIFNPFERAQGSATRKIQGTGLGMAIVKNIVDMMGGIIKISSVPGEGTVITVIVNLRIIEKEDREKLPQLPVLVVDDDELCCVSTSRLLVDIGMIAEWVLTGQEAVKKCIQARTEGCSYFAVILDWKMPGMDGLETARQIREQVGDDVPIIILTAYDYEQIETEAKEAGVTEFLPKPLFRSKLYYKMKHLVNHEDTDQKDLCDAAGAFNFEGKHILLVEDNELNMEIAVNILSFTHAEIDCAYDGEAALSKYTSQPEGSFDLILLDIQMPVMNGYEATKAIRDSGLGDAHKIPVIAMTANAFMEDREKARDAGMDGYITKPINIEELMSVLEQQLKGDR